MQTDRLSDQNSFSFNNFSLPDGNGFGFDEFAGAGGNGFSFDDFIGSEGNGYTFGEFDFHADGVPLESGLLVLSVLSLLYLGRKKEE